MYTNTRIADSVVTNEDYAKRAIELGHGIISTLEHGWQGRYIEGYELAKKYNLKFVFGTEAYWVKNRNETIIQQIHKADGSISVREVKDSSNCHICIFARNENGRQAINDILSEANISGYYVRPRIDLELLFKLPPNDVIVTSACVAFWKYDDIDDIVVQMHQYFNENFYLEVQYHNTEKQRTINKHILELAQLHNISLIMGCDSHYIDEAQDWERTDFLASKGIHYEDEEGWFLDYPDGNTAYQRFANQCVLSHEQILEAINNTNVFLEVEEYDCPIFNKEIKLPTIYPKLTQEQRDKKFTDLIWKLWEEQRNDVPKSDWLHYTNEIMEEVQTVIDTQTADYFLLDYEIVKLAKERGGELTPTGRGSAVSFYITKLLGFTKVDRIAAKVKMYPERFMSTIRILQSKTLPDIDMNVSSPEIFWQAQKDIIGQEHAYQMVAYGQMKPPAAWKMYAKASNIDFETSNEVSKQIKRWQMAVAHADEDEKDEIDIYDYIAPQYHEIYEKSKQYQGIVSNWSPHPCASLVYKGNIRKEIGLTFIKPTGSKEGMICCLMDGHWAEDYKFLKNDWLTVKVVKLMYKVYRRIGIEIPTVNQLLKMCAEDGGKTWDIYKRRCTLGINQVEQVGTSARVGVYAPRNISELCAFVAAIRPGFKSMYKIFESRKPFSYNIPSFDMLIQTDEMPNSFVLYQEMAMAALNYAGIPMSECYTVVKHISKKRTEKVLAYKNQFIQGFKEKIMHDEKKSADVAEQLSTDIWQILEDSSRYSFNASHSYCVSLDGLYCAWAKAHHPLEFYESFLQILEEKSDKDRMKLVQAEATQYFNISFPPFKYGQDNTKIAMNQQTNSIMNSLSSIKGFTKTLSKALLDCSKQPFDNFMSIILWLKTKKRITPTKLEPLVKIGYFSEYGNINELLTMLAAFEFLKQGEAKQISKDKLEGNILQPVITHICSDLKKDGTAGKSYIIYNGKDTEIQLEIMTKLLLAVGQYIKSLQLPDISAKEKMYFQNEILGYIDLTTGKVEDVRKLYITDVFPLKNKSTNQIWSYVLDTKSIGTGKTSSLNVYVDIFKNNPINKSDIIYADHVFKNNKGYWYLDKYHIIQEI